MLQIHGVWKRFGHVVALRDASLTAASGEVLALVGDNGAGKSTMIKVLSGIHAMDRGTLRLDGQEVRIRSPLDAKSLGISTVHQNLALVDALDVAENLYLGQLETRFGIFSDRRSMRRGAERTLATLGVELPEIATPVGMLSGGQRQAVAIARSVHEDGRVILMDEPTAALGVRESEQVKQIITRLADQGRAVIVISHDMEMVFQVADRIQVMRLGAVQGVRSTSETNREEIVGLITGLVGPDTSSPAEGARR